ncbi:MAG: crosslink repair DNA glycosylase YcaQ family protein [Candidatus Limnocylindrales bacterium]
MTPRTFSADAARRFLVTRHLLAPARSLPPGPEGILQAFERLGSVQFDPLAVAGRNHDLVLHARVRDYVSKDTDHLLYGTRQLFEAYNKGLSLLPTHELPWHRHTWDRHDAYYRDGVFVRHADTVDHVLERIRTEGPLATIDFERRPAVDWAWGPTGEIRAVMEALAEAGVLGLARRDGNRRYYDLMERLFPAELLAVRPSPEEQVRHRLLSRYRAHGMLGMAGQAELWLGTGPAKADPQDPLRPSRIAARSQLIEAGDIVPVQIEGIKGPRFVLRGEVADLERAERDAPTPLPDPSVTFLAALDPFVWDRGFLRTLFGFDYIWEVYVPEAKRKWGYYVLPILFGDRLVGRIEPRIDRATNTIKVLHLWWESGFDPGTADGFVPAMRDALAAYRRFGNARGIEWAPSLGRERRRFGVSD